MEKSSQTVEKAIIRLHFDLIVLGLFFNSMLVSFEKQPYFL